MKDKTNENLMKEKIKNKAFSLMAKKGLKDISMREIAEACGVTKPVLYYYFKDKEDLCYSLIVEKNIVSNENLKKFAASASSLKEILVFIFSEFVKDISHKDVFPFVVHVSSYLLSNPELGKRFQVVRDQNFAVLSEILEKEYKKGFITKKGKEIGLQLILANIAHLILNSCEHNIKFSPTYPKDMAQAILKAIDYREK
ncbi:MAG: TetR/AcrR family transcriptional regulator [Elusimicrobia bacterium]|nr:TetR/AcrR family transcriptional regulator [Elusimicrobiota bacterium]